MRPYLELVEIGLKLHNLEEIKEFLKNILEDVDLVKKKGELWIEEKVTSTFMEMKQSITEKTSEILKRCTSLTKLQAASSFISQQQTQCETFCLELKEKQEIDKEHKELDVSTKFEEIYKKQKELSKKFENILEIQESQAKDFEDRNNSAKEIVKIKDDQRKLFCKIRNVQMEITRGREKDFFCEKTGQTDVKCIKNCLHIIGQHDQQISEGGQDYLHEYLADCLRNPGHLDFIPVDTLGLEHLPEDIRDKDLYDLIKAVADLTVRVNVTMTSPLRPMFWSDTKTPYSLYNMRGSQELRTGNGMVQNVVKILAETCPCQKCQLSGDPKPNYWSVGVGTVVSLVYDNIEASHTTCRFFYDTEYSSEIVLKVEDKNVNKSIENDLSFFYCSTCDETLVDKLEKSLKQLSRLQQRVDTKYKKTFDENKLMFLLSHPHGCSKRVCFGQWKDKYTKNVVTTKYTYLTSICPGCSGGPVYFLGDRRYYHSGSLNSGLGYNTNG